MRRYASRPNLTCKAVQVKSRSSWVYRYVTRASAATESKANDAFRPPLAGSAFEPAGKKTYGSVPNEISVRSASCTSPMPGQ